jgi:hypothetical protein
VNNRKARTKTKNRAQALPDTTTPVHTSNPDTSDKSSTATSTTNQCQQPSKPTWKTPPFWQAVFSACLVLNAGFTIYFLSRQQENTVKALNLTRDHFQQEQRPYLWVTNNLGSPAFVPNPKTPAAGQVIWTYHFTNYGKTPAYKIRFVQYMKLGDGPLVQSYGEPSQSIGAPLPPNKDDFSTIVSEPITQQQFLEFSNGPGGITMQAHFSYTDGFGGSYVTHLCARRTNAGSITYCKEGNDIRDESPNPR